LVALNVNVALTDVSVEGVNVTVKGMLWPAAMVTGSVSPLTVNTELLELALVIVTLAPVTLNVPEAVPLNPTTTLPRAREDGETVSWPVAATPVPDRAIVSVGLEAFEVTVTVPVAAAAVVGANVTLKLALWPAAKVTGAVIPLRVNPVPVMLT